MKILKKAGDLLTKFENQYGIQVVNASQGSDEWLKLKQGVISASNAQRVVAKTDSATRATYMAELIAQVGTGISKDLNTRHMEWGVANEDAARSYYEFMTDSTLTQLLFIFKDDKFRIGVSPDSLVQDRGVEIKCPYDSTNYVLFAIDDKIKPEYKWQANFSMWVTGLNHWDFVQYDPRMKKNPMKIITLEKDEKKIATFEDAVPQFMHDMDRKLKKIGISFGEQWEGSSQEEMSA